MQNDLIVFEFSNNDGREVLLPPDVPIRLAEICRNLVNLVVRENDVRQKDTSAEFWLAAVDSGSIKIGFRQALSRPQPMSLKEKVELASSMMDVLNKAWRFIFASAAAYGVFVFAADGQELQTEEGTRNRPDIQHQLTQLAGLVSKSGVDRCVIRHPELPDANVVVDWANRGDRIGSLATKIPPLGNVQGTLDDISAPVEGTQQMVNVIVQAGKLTVDGESYPVVFMVPLAKGPLPRGEAFEVQGSLTTIERDELILFDPLTQPFLEAGALLRIKLSRSLKWS